MSQMGSKAPHAVEARQHLMSGLALIATELLRGGSPPLRADFVAKVVDDLREE